VVKAIRGRKISRLQQKANASVGRDIETAFESSTLVREKTASIDKESKKRFDIRVAETVGGNPRREESFSGKYK